MPTKPDSHSYVFDDFRVEPASRLLLKADQPIEIGERAFDVLMMLLENPGQVVERKTILDEVWRDVFVDPSNVDQSVFVLRNALGDTSRLRRYIRSVPRRGFVFVAPVSRVESLEVGVEDPVIAQPRIVAPVSVWVPASSLHLIVSCGLYGLLFAVGIFLETAYQFDRLWLTATKLAVAAFLLVSVSSWLALRFDRRQTLRDGKGTLVAVIAIFVLVGFMMAYVLGLGLPDTVVTQSKFQALPAQAAYIKNVHYFLPLAILFIIIPFHFVVSAERELNAGRYGVVLDILTGRRRAITMQNAVYLRPLWLVGLLVLALVGSQIAQARLVDNLIFASHMNLFVKLVEVRRIVYFALGLECLLWYQTMINSLKKRCHEALTE